MQVWIGVSFLVTKKKHQKTKRKLSQVRKHLRQEIRSKNRLRQVGLEFTMEDLQLFINHFYRVLKPGGTCIVFFDLWKITPLKEQLESAKFKQIRFIEWLKTNPQPINSKVNYLTNCREIALLGIKKSKPTFNSSYDKGV